MTVPNGPAGINAAGWPAIISAAGHSATSAADLKGLDQDTVVELFKEKFVGTKGSGVSVFTSNTGPLAEVFKGLPNIPGGSLPLRIVAGIAGRLLGVDPLTLVSGTTNEEQITSVIHALEKVPFLGEIIELLTGIEDGDPNDLATWARGLLNELSPINLANAFGRLSLAQYGGGVPLNALTTAVANELQPFSATSVPTVDGWSFDAAADAAKVVCDGTEKNLYLKSGVIKVEPDQPLNTSIKVKYSGVGSTAGQGIRYVLETFTTADGSGPSTPVVLGSIPNPTGTISSPVMLGDSSWDIPAGVQSVRPVLTNDALAAGTIYWLNTPLLAKPLLGVLANGLAAAIQQRIDDLAALVHDLLTNPAAVIGTITQGMVSGLGDLNTLVNQIRDILAGLVVTPINSTVQAIKDWFTGNQAKTQALNSSGQLNGANVTGAIAEAVTGLNTVRDAFVNGLFGGILGSGYTNTQAQDQAATVAQQAQAAVAAAAAANAALAAQNAQNAGQGAGGFYTNIVPSGTDGTALAGSQFTATGPTSGNLCIRGNSGFVGIAAGVATNTVGSYATVNGTYTTDNQLLEIILGDQGAWSGAATYGLFHSDPANTAGVYVAINNSQISIGQYTRSGASYSFGSPWRTVSNVKPAQGNRVGVYNVGTTYTITLNGNAVDTVTNSGATFGAGNRSAHIAMDRIHSSGFFGWGAADYDGFRVAAVSMADYSLPTYAGSGARMTRSLTASVTPNRNSGSYLLPASVFNVMQEQTNDIVSDLTNGKFTVSIAGWYKVTGRFLSNGYITTSGGNSYGDQTMLLYKNGNIHKWGHSHVACVTGASDNIGHYSLHGTFEVYLAAGDYVQLGYNNSANMYTTFAITGEATNAQTYFDIVLLNRSYA